MASSQGQSSSRPPITIIVLFLLVVTAIALTITKFKLPGRKISVDQFATAILNANTSAQNTNTTSTQSLTNSTMPTYTFPGQLPAEKIHHKQARIVTNKGTIVFTLDDAQAPLAVSSFVFLAEQGYFSGLTWHRVIPDFVIQGGDPTGTGTGGPGYTFPDETVTGEYTEGTVAMANAGPNTNGSQFFICNADDTQKLAKSYSIFGHVTHGLDVVKAIVQGDTMQTVTIEEAGTK